MRSLTVLLCWGIANRLRGGLRLFFYEYDDIDDAVVYDDANFLSQVFDIDIYVLESSPRHYHLISFDLLTFETVNSVQNWTSVRGDYINGKDRSIDGGLPHNTLRLGAKGRKGSPKFVKVFYATPNKHLKSAGHFNAWKALTGLPDPPEDRRDRFVLFGSATLSVYKTGIGVKRKTPPETFRVR